MLYTLISTEIDSPLAPSSTMSGNSTSPDSGPRSSDGTRLNLDLEEGVLIGEGGMLMGAIALNHLASMLLGLPPTFLSASLSRSTSRFLSPFLSKFQVRFV